MALENQMNTGPEDIMEKVQPDASAAESIGASAFSLTGSFESELISKLPAMTSEQLSQLEELLSKEFSDLSGEYLKARETRVDDILATIDCQIKRCKAKDQEWTQKYNYESDLIDRLANNTENQILAGSKGTGSHRTISSVQKFDREVTDLMSSLVLPIELDDIFGAREGQLPFAPQFHRIIQQYRIQLDALINHKEYQENLVDQNVEKTKAILWKQYRREALEHRQRLIDETYLELNELYKEYHGIKDNNFFNVNADKYYRSVVSVDDMKQDAEEKQQRRFSLENTDSYYDIDSRYYKINRIQITDTKMAALDRVNRFEAQQRNYLIPQVEEADVKLSGLQGLTKEETESDLMLLRKNIRHNVKKSSGPSSPLKSNQSVSEFQAVLGINRIPSQVEMKPLEFPEPVN